MTVKVCCKLEYTSMIVNHASRSVAMFIVQAADNLSHSNGNCICLGTLGDLKMNRNNLI